MTSPSVQLTLGPRVGGDPHPALAGFHPAVAEWFRRRFPEGPTAPQAEGWPHIAAGLDTLIAAPTGRARRSPGSSSCIDRLYRAHDAGEPVDGVTRVVYVSPLKALAVDIAENLERPLAEIAADRGRSSGLDAPDIRVAVRTGDTTSSRARRDAAPAAELRRHHARVALPARHQRKRPRAAAHHRDRDRRRDPRRRARQARRAPRAHARAARGALRAAARSASASRPRSARSRPSPACSSATAPLPAIVDAGHQRDLDLALELPDGELEAVTSAEQMGDVLDRIAELVGEHRTTLVFVNTRRLAERLAHQLGERLGDDVGRRAPRQPVEGPPPPGRARLRAGELKALVATASLELGIDIGPVELVCQIGSPRSIATFLQRVGRSNHTRARHAEGPPVPADPRRARRVRGAARRGARRAARRDRAPRVCRSTSSPSRSSPRPARRSGAPTTSSRSCAAPRRTRELDRARSSTRSSSSSPTASRPAAARAARTCTTTRSTASCAAARARGSPRSRRAARSPRPATTAWSPSPTTRSSARSTRTGPSSRWRATSSCSARTRGRSAGSRPGVVRVRDAGDAAADRPVLDGRGAGAHRRAVGRGVGAAPPRSTSSSRAGDPDGAAHVARSRPRASTPTPPTMIVDYLAVGRAVLGVMPTLEHLVLERFFDDTGGMQLVLHSPLRRPHQPRARARAAQEVLPHVQLRAAGRRHRRRGRALARPAPQLPARRGAALRVSSQTVEDTLRARDPRLADVPGPLALEPQPRRSSSCASAAAEEPAADPAHGGRRPHGRGVPAGRGLPGERHRPDRDPRPPARAPDDQRHAARGARRRRPARAARAHRVGDVTVHCVDTTEPSVLAHEILTARPYAFLDDEELQNRRTNAVHAPARPVRRPRVDRRARARRDRAGARRDRRPSPSTRRRPARPPELARAHARPRRLARAVGRARRRAAAARSLDRDGAELWCTTERRDDAERALAGDDDAVAAVLRGHLEIAGITTVDALADGDHAAGRRASRPGSRCSSTRASRCRVATRGARRRPSGWRAGCSRACTRTRGAPGAQGVEPATAQDFMRFLLRWQHVAPGTQLAGEAGLARRARAAPGLRGGGGGVGARAARAPAAATTTRRWLDRLCHDGEVGWLRLTPRARDDADAPAGPPSKATPISVVFRADLAVAARSRPRAAPIRPSRRSARPPRSSRCSRDARRVLRGRARRRDQPAARRHRARAVGRRRPRPAHLRRLRRDPRARERQRPTPAPTPRALVAAAARRPLAGRRPPAAGRSSRRTGADIDRDELAEAVAELLLRRWGVVFRDLAVHDSLRFPWREVQWALRRLEDRGLVRGGRFVTGFTRRAVRAPGGGRAARARAQARAHRRARRA